MRILLFDDSVPYDGYTAMTHPLGGAEKALAGLAAALSGRGHEVHAFNRCRFRMTIEGVQWEPWDRPRPFECDALIAYRKPMLLGQVRQAKRRVLWVTAPPAYLNRTVNLDILDTLKPELVFVSEAQRILWTGSKTIRPLVIPNGVRKEYLDEAPISPSSPPIAVTTAHPLQGLDWLIGLWRERIHPALPDAKLHVYSMSLDKGRQGGAVDEALKPIFDLAIAASQQGVEIRRPGGDLDMSPAYRQARVHLHPGHPDDMLASTLAESQAAGIPAVARPLGAAAERIQDGRTGFLAPDEAAFANTALTLLKDDGVFWGFSRDAKLLQAGRSWEIAAEQFEAVLAQRPA